MRPLTVAVTGGLGAGKSSALEAFRGQGAEAMSLDRIAHALSRRGGALARAVARAFGPRYLGSDGGIDRPALARAVFSRPALRRRLERAAHPIILRDMRRRIRNVRRSVVVVEAPLLFEAGWGGLFDLTVLIDAPAGLRVRRAMRRDGATRGRVLGMLGAQMPPARKRALADILISNDGSLCRFREKAADYGRAFRLLSEGAAASCAPRASKSRASRLPGKSSHKP